MVDVVEIPKDFVAPHTDGGNDLRELGCGKSRLVLENRQEVLQLESQELASLKVKDCRGSDSHGSCVTVLMNGPMLMQPQLNFSFVVPDHLLAWLRVHLVYEVLKLVVELEGIAAVKVDYKTRLEG